MRDVTRIERVLAVVERVWSRHPDTRLCQLIRSVTADLEDDYYLEDDELEARLLRYESELERTLGSTGTDR